MKILIRQTGTDVTKEIPEESWPAYLAAGWMLVSLVPVDPIKPKLARKK